MTTLTPTSPLSARLRATVLHCCDSLTHTATIAEIRHTCVSVIPGRYMDEIYLDLLLVLREMASAGEIVEGPAGVYRRAGK